MHLSLKSALTSFYTSFYRATREKFDLILKRKVADNSKFFFLFILSAGLEILVNTFRFAESITSLDRFFQLLGVFFF